MAAQAPRTTDRGRLNHLTAKEAREEPDIVTGEFMISGNKALVLFDSGTTSSYVTTKFVR